MGKLCRAWLHSIQKNSNNVDNDNICYYFFAIRVKFFVDNYIEKDYNVPERQGCAIIPAGCLEGCPGAAESRRCQICKEGII